MNKKLLSLVLTLVMVLGAFTTVFAAETTTTEKVEKIVGKDNKIQYVIDKKLVEGYEDGSYQLDKNITRAEITKLLAIANGNKSLADKLQGSMKLYSDVDNSHWANGVITVGTTVPSASNGQPMLQGYPNGTFMPENNVTYAELAKMLVVLVKTDLTADMVKEANAKWAGLWLTWAQQLGILDDVTVADSNAAATRGDAFTMVYNALYKMQNFKRTAANEKLGVLSALNRDKLTLNQDSAQTYTITTDTVFVQTAKLNDNSNIVKVQNIVNPNYYLGSLVRIIVNDKNEVTHILELGNPKEMALNANANVVANNSRWNGVADYTVETGFSDVTKLGVQGDDAIIPNGYVSVNFKSNDTKVASLTFKTMSNDNVATVSIDSATRVFVANPANNIMREVKDINEAMALIGYNSARWSHIANVYAGFNSNGTNKYAISDFNQANANTAKVVVFNVVAKSAGSDMYRVVNQANSLGNTTLEETSGKLVERNFLNNMVNFPYNYGDLYDVIKVAYATNTNTDGIATVIDHSNTDKFPIVEVTGWTNDKKVLNVVDKYGDISALDVRDADIFNATQYANLKAGDKIQFHVVNGTEVDVVSILPANTALAGSIQGIVTNISNRTHVGFVTIDKISTEGPEAGIITIDIREFRDNLNVNAGTQNKTYTLSESEAAKLYDTIKKAATDANLADEDAAKVVLTVKYEVSNTSDRNFDGRAFNFTTEKVEVPAAVIAPIN